MLQEEVLITRLVDRIESGNTFILKNIGQVIKEIGNLTPSQAHSLEQMIKYGARYDTIVARLSQITNLNAKEINIMFEEYAKKDYRFAKQFYDYKNIEYIPFNEMTALKNEVNAIERLTNFQYMNLVKTNAIGFKLEYAPNKFKFFNLRDSYNYAIDQALLSITQGKDTFQHQMYSLLKEFGNSGIRTIDYASGTSRRLDSALKMNLREGIRELHNTTQEVLGKEFGADGVEITVHEYPAPDHAMLQGRQFSYQEYENLQNNLPATDYKGITYTHEHRPISKLNCYHNKFDIVLGVSKPQYTNEELEQIEKRNTKGFDFEGKHYTMYEGTQLQRRIETEIRKQKDNQILGVSADNKELIGYSQQKITQLTIKYKDLLKASGLKSQLKRARVVGYKRVKVK